MRCLRHRVAGVAIAAALSIGIMACRGREAARQDSGETSPDAAHFTPGGAPPQQLNDIEVAQDRLWLTTDRDVIAIDPVKETWAVLNLGSRRMLQADHTLPCAAEVGLVMRDTLARVDLKTGQFQYVEVRGLLGPMVGRARVACGEGGFWVYSAGTLFRAPAAGVDSKRYQIPWPSQSVSLYDFAGLRDGAAYFVVRGPNGPPALFRFDTTTSRLDEIPMPGLFPNGLEWSDQGLVIRTSDRKKFLLKSSGRQIEEIVPPTEDNLATEPGVIWVGASYDVSPASYFVLRYIKDIKEPKDLVILEGWYRPRLPAVSYLGMLWAISNNRLQLLRVDPGAEELTRYAFTDSSGTLVKKSVHLIKEGDELLYFNGDTLKKFEEPAPTPPEPSDTTSAVDSVVTSNLGEEAERQRFLNSDLLPVELEVLRRIWSIQHPDELPLGLPVVPARREDLAERKGRCHVLGKGVANELKARDRLAIILAARKDLGFEI